MYVFSCDLKSKLCLFGIIFCTMCIVSFHAQRLVSEKKQSPCCPDSLSQLSTLIMEDTNRNTTECAVQFEERCWDASASSALTK